VKEGGVVKSWKRRYFILHRTQLFYYRENRKVPLPSSPNLKSLHLFIFIIELIFLLILK
jgi:hypothetical protein